MYRKFSDGRVVLEIREQTDRQTDTLITILSTLTGCQAMLCKSPLLLTDQRDVMRHAHRVVHM